MIENISSIKERILYYAKYQGIGIEKFLTSIDMTYGSFKGDAKKRSLNSDAIEKIYTTYPALNIEWLLSGKGEMLKNVTHEPLTGRSSNNDPGIPLVIHEAAAGFGTLNFAISNQDIQAFYKVPDFHDIDFMIRVTGNSMYPKYNSGDVVACRILRNSKFIEWNKPHLISTTEHGLLVKRLRKSHEANCVTAYSDNKEYEPFDIPENEVTGIAIIIGVIRLE